MATTAPISQGDTLTGQPSKRVRRRRRARAILRFMRRVIPLLIVGAIVYRALTDRVFLNFLLVAFQFIFQLLFAIMFILIQFIALFWFIFMRQMRGQGQGLLAVVARSLVISRCPQ